MRFSENCFDIPDDLIQAHEQGQVVFFCGSGISRMADGLPDFWGLADIVVNDLRAAKDSDARRFLLAAKKIRTKHPELSSVTTADQLFSLLELEFLTEDIERSVLKALTPSGNVDLIYHRTILELAKTHNGRIQLVTTNFDRLFEKADKSIKSWVAPRFPELDKGAVFDGLVYLHGRASDDYSSSDGHDVILNTADFGHAYISDGWAARFFKQTVEQFSVVFVGYSADDPPINFLLRALKKYRGKIKGLYAFESGSQQIATERWSHKGVVGIAFPFGDYDCLWQTLKEWSKFHNRKNEWFSELFHKASAGPAFLKPYEREQVTFLAKSVEGVKRILGANPVLPADWLCVFDRNRRYAERSYIPMDEPDSIPTAFSIYGLATDPIAQITSADAGPFRTIDHTIPDNAWHAFRITKGDFDSDNRHENLVDGLADGEHELPERLLLLSNWIAKSIDHPACLWWAQQQTNSLHGQLRKRLIQQLLYPVSTSFNAPLRKEWLKLRHTWQQKAERSRQDWHRVERCSEKYGWSLLTVNDIAESFKPKLKVRSYDTKPIAPSVNDDYQLNIEVNYQEAELDLDIPKDFLPGVVSKIRENLLLAVELEYFTSDSKHLFINTLTPDPEASSFSSFHGINSLIKIFLDLFTKLKKSDISLAQQEYLTWPVKNCVFSTLKVFAARDPLISDSTDFGDLINKGLDKDQLWANSGSRELYLSLKERWGDLSEDNQKAFCHRLLSGRNQYNYESEREWLERRAFDSLNSIHWLKSANCELRWISDCDIAELKLLAPDWLPEYANILVRVSGVFGGVIQTNTDFDIFNGLSEKEILDKALEPSSREPGSLIDNKPFQGYSKHQPLKALNIIKKQIDSGNFTRSLWTDFFSYRTRDNDPSELSCSIAEVLLILDNEQLDKISHQVFRWFGSAIKKIKQENCELLRKLTQKLFNYLVLKDSDEYFDLDNLLNAAINHPAGMFVDAIFDGAEGGFVPDYHLDMIGSLINREGADGNMVLALSAARLTWFYYHNPRWTKDHILKALSESDERQIVLWIGFLWTAIVPETSLFKQIKTQLLEFAKSNIPQKRSLTNNLAKLVLSGWFPSTNTSKRSIVTDKELIDTLLSSNDDFRTSLLWYLRRWMDENKDYDWRQVCYRLFHDVWPKQKALKTDEINNCLYNFLLSRKDYFNYYFDLIFPLVTTCRSPKLDYFKFQELKECYSGPLQYPELTLKLLRKILPFDAREWSYGAEEYIQYFFEHCKEQPQNADLNELVARLNRR